MLGIAVEVELGSPLAPNRPLHQVERDRSHLLTCSLVQREG
jgi:hypothetical protein